MLLVNDTTKGPFIKFNKNGENWTDADLETTWIKSDKAILSLSLQSSSDEYRELLTEVWKKQNVCISAKKTIPLSYD